MFQSDLIDRARREIVPDPTVFERFHAALGQFAVNLVVAVVIVAVTWLLARHVGPWVKRFLRRFRGTRDDLTLQIFFAQVARWLVIVIGAIAVLRRLGVETTSIIAVLGAASLAVGLALQGALSNVAAGVLLLVLRPYKVGDFVELAGKTGTVRRLDLFTTELATPDNLKVVAPNSKVIADVLVNQSGHDSRRIELAFDVDFEGSIAEARRVLAEAAAAHPKVLVDPAPWTGATALKDSALQVSLHCWTTAGDWWQTRADLLEAGLDALRAAGQPIPYPHQVAVERE